MLGQLGSLVKGLMVHQNRRQALLAFTTAAGFGTPLVGQAKPCTKACPEGLVCRFKNTRKKGKKKVMFCAQPPRCLPVCTNKCQGADNLCGGTCPDPCPGKDCEPGGICVERCPVNIACDQVPLGTCIIPDAGCGRMRECPCAEGTFCSFNSLMCE